MGQESVLAGARYDLAAFGELVSEPSRVAMLLALMDGSVRPATELARIASVTRATASSHLGRLLAGALVEVEQVGRHRYYRLASEEVADALEAVSLLRPPPNRVRRAAQSPAHAQLSAARTCYRHLAGKLGVAWLGALEARGLVALEQGALALTARGARQLASLGIERPRFPAGKPCLDWTERRPHLGGPLGTLLTEELFRLKWIARRRDSRALRVTSRGERELSTRFGLRLGQSL